MKRLRRPVSEEDIEVWRTELNDHLIHALECKAGGVNFYPEKLFADSLEVVATLRERIAELKSRLKEQAQLKQIPSEESKKCKRCGYEGQDTKKYDGYCYQCYADVNNIQ